MAYKIPCVVFFEPPVHGVGEDLRRLGRQQDAVAPVAAGDPEVGPPRLPQDRIPVHRRRPEAGPRLVDGPVREARAQVHGGVKQLESAADVAMPRLRAVFDRGTHDDAPAARDQIRLGAVDDAPRAGAGFAGGGLESDHLALLASYRYR